MRRRRLVIVLAVLAVGGAAAAIAGSRHASDSMYRVDAVFDTARGLLPGGRVKIAGANVGVIDDIRLTRDRKALVEMRIDKRFGPFHSDAYCSSRPQGLVGVADVNCSPGTPSGAALHTGEGGHPTLPVNRTSVPVSITDFFEIWQTPVRDRLRVLLNELGMSLSGRGEQLNDLLLRANPTLGKARRVLGIIASQRQVLAQSITDSDRAIAQLAADRAATRRLVDEGAKTSKVTADHERALAAGIAGLPPLLARSKSALDQLDALNRSSLPLVDELHASAPALDRLASDTVPFSELALPSVRSLQPALQQGNATAKVLGPFVRGLARFTQYAVPAGELQSALQTDLRDQGVYDNLLKLFYVGASSISRFDSIAHIDPSHVTAVSCATYQSTVDPKCEYHWVPQGSSATRAKHRAKRRHRHRGAAAPAPAASAPGAPGAPAAPKLPPVKVPPLPKLPPLPNLPQVKAPAPPQAANQLLKYLLG